jgi:Domain of unknown function (DUF4347)
MIHLNQPALALYAHDLVNVPRGYRNYCSRMKITWAMPKGASSSDVVSWILSALKQTPEERLNNVVIGCHGLPGRLYVGGELGLATLDSASVGLFNELRTKEIGTIWLQACWVAYGGNGQNFCSQLAKCVGCDVVAADAAQFVENAFYKGNTPFGAIDEFEGTAYRFSPSGKKEVLSIHNVEAERGAYYTGNDGKQKPQKP